MLDQLITTRSFDVVPHVTALIIAYALAFPIGTAVGLGSIDVAVVLSLFTIVTLWALSPLKRRDNAVGEGRDRD